MKRLIILRQEKKEELSKIHGISLSRLDKALKFECDDNMSQTLQSEAVTIYKGIYYEQAFPSFAYSPEMGKLLKRLMEKVTSLD
jgi:hypothetical protein